MKIKIKDDLFDIAWRVKAVDDAYEIFYDTSLHRYEVFADGNLQVTVPYKTLDTRTVELVRKTRVERINKLIADMEKHNAEIEFARESKLRDEVKYKSKHVVDYIARGGTDIPSYENV